MQSRGGLLKNTQFLLAFHALCAKTVELVFDTWCDERLLWLKKKRSLFNSGLEGDMLKGVL